MGCFVTGTAEGDSKLHADEARGKATETTDMLCTVMQRIEGTQEFNLLPLNIREWWIEHQEIDKEPSQ